MNVPILLLIASLPNTSPILAGVLSRPDAATSHWVEFDLKKANPPKTRLQWQHARGWMPKVALNSQETQLLVTLLPPGRGHGHLAQLWHCDLKSGDRTLVSKRVLPGQTALFTRWGPLYVREVDGKKQQWLGRKMLGPSGLISEAELWWPLKVVDDAVFILALIEKDTQLLKQSLRTGKIQVLMNWRADSVRDLSFTDNHIRYQRQTSLKHFAIEELDIKTNKVNKLLQFNLPHLSPVSFGDSVLFSLSPSAVSGRLGWWRKGEIKPGPDLGHGAPIPLLAKNKMLLIRRQSKSQQAYFVWNSENDDVYPLKTDGDLLDSVTFLSGSAAGAKQ